MIQHEFMHAAGVEHEHNRYDRDEYIKLLEDNIIAARKHDLKLVFFYFYVIFSKMH